MKSKLNEAVIDGKDTEDDDYEDNKTAAYDAAKESTTNNTNGSSQSTESDTKGNKEEPNKNVDSNNNQNVESYLKNKYGMTIEDLDNAVNIWKSQKQGVAVVQPTTTDVSNPNVPQGAQAQSAIPETAKVDANDTPAEAEAKYDFNSEWAKVKQQVKTMQNSYKTQVMPIVKQYQGSNPKIQQAIENVGGVMAGLGSIMGIAGTIAMFIPGGQAIGMGLSAAGRAVGGAGTAMNRGSAAVTDFRNGNIGKGLMNAGMAAVGGLTAASGIKSGIGMLGNKSSVPVGASAAQSTNSSISNPNVEANIPKVQIPTTAQGCVDLIGQQTGGDLSNWPSSSKITSVFTPEQIEQMRNTITNSPEGQRQLQALANSKGFANLTDVAKKNLIASKTGYDIAVKNKDSMNWADRLLHPQKYTNMTNRVNNAANNVSGLEQSIADNTRLAKASNNDYNSVFTPRR